ncbi:MAG: MaoC family dehydratase N-terminal domain-containing protein [Dehalococcoidia bacterium]
MTTEAELVPAELKELMGKESDPGPEFVVEAGHVRRFAEAIGDDNPIYRDPKAAEAVGGLVAPPTFFTAVSMPWFPEPKWTWGTVSLAAGRTAMYNRPIRVGDVLRSTVTLVDVYTRPGRNGSLVFTVQEATVRDQSGEVVVRVQRAMARR